VKVRVKAIVSGLCLVVSLAFAVTANADETVDASLPAVAAVAAEELAAVASEPDVTGATPKVAKEQESTKSSVSLLALLDDKKSVSSGPVDDAAVAKMIFGLVVVLGLIFLSSWVLKRFNINKFGMAKSLSVSGVLPIGAKEKVVVIDVEGTRLVLGVTATTITKLHTLDSSSSISSSSSLQQSQPRKAQPAEDNHFVRSDFSEKLKKMITEGIKGD